MQAALILWSVAIAMLVVAIGTGIYDTLKTRQLERQVENAKPINWGPAPVVPFDDEIEIQAEITRVQKLRIEAELRAHER